MSEDRPETHDAEQSADASAPLSGVAAAATEPSEVGEVATTSASGATPPESGTPVTYWTRAPERIASDWKVISVLALILLAAYLPGLGSYGLYDPWETHYGEVARNMVENDNYIDPFWGSPWDPQGVKRERAGFYSKPPLIMWMMSGGMNLFGYTELGVRFFFPLVMIMALLAIYLAVSRFYNRRTGLIATLIAASSPFIAFMSRQAVTDGPLVAIITAGMMCLGLGLFGGDEEDEASSALYWFTVGFFLLVALGQLWVLLPMDRSPDIVRPYAGDRWFFFSIQWWVREVITVGAGKGWVLSVALLPLLGWATYRVARQRQRRMMYIYLFYICCGLVVPAKGWLGWAPMGGTILAYVIISGDWKVFTRVDVITGLLIVLMAGHPWILAMLTGHHPGWWNRFIIHDHYKRLFSGVHSIDDGAFEYFIKWIGYGLFPWIGLLPAGLIRIFASLRGKIEEYTPRQKFELLLVFWSIFGFFLFSKSSTKFHHYIFPVIPPLAIISALFVEDVIARKARNMVLLLVCAAGLTAWVGQDLHRMPAAYGQSSQNLVNLFTYKYDREWAKYTPPERLEKMKPDAREKARTDNEWLNDFANPLRMITLISVVGFLLFAARREWLSEAGGLFVAFGGVWCALFCLHSYLPEVSRDWSQKEMWAAYYDDCTKYKPSEELEYRRHMLNTSSRVPKKLDTFPRAWCKEPVVAFRTNWRGETFYSANTTQPAMETKHFKPFLEQWGNTKPFYLFTERSRVKSELEPNLPKHLKGQYREVFGTNLKFVLLRIEKGTKPKTKPDSPKRSPGSQTIPARSGPKPLSGGGE